MVSWTFPYSVMKTILKASFQMVTSSWSFLRSIVCIYLFHTFMIILRAKNNIHLFQINACAWKDVKHVILVWGSIAFFSQLLLSIDCSHLHLDQFYLFMMLMQKTLYIYSTAMPMYEMMLKHVILIWGSISLLSLLLVLLIFLILQMGILNNYFD